MKRLQWLGMSVALAGGVVVALVAIHGHVEIGSVLGRWREALAEMPDSESLMLIGTLFFCGAGLCVCRAAGVDQASVAEVRCGSTAISRGVSA